MNITVALLTYNRAGNCLKESIEAILSQTYKDFTFLILDNHSEDNTSEVILSLKDPRITYVRQPPNKGPDFNFTSAILMSSSTYVLVTHDDDVMEPQMLEKYVKFISDNPNILCVTSNISLMDSAGKMLQERLYSFEQDRLFRKGDYIQAFIDEILWLPTPTQLFRRDAMLKIMKLSARKGNKVNNTTTPSGDILMNCQLNAIGSICILKEPLLRYRQHDMQISRHINQSKPLIYVIKKIISEAKTYLAIKKHVPSLHALYLRFYLQNIFFESYADFRPDRISRKLIRLKSYVEKHLSGNQRLSVAILPAEIIYRLFGLQLFDKQYACKRLSMSNHQTPATESFMKWLHRLDSGLCLFGQNDRCRRVAIFGSMLLAFMLVLDAMKSGVEVVYCIDTSDARVGRTVFGVPVVPFSDVDLARDRIDIIVMSNERGNEAAIRAIVSDRLVTDNVPIISWKEFVA